MLILLSIIISLRCNFGVMLLTEIVADSPEVQWIINLPLMLHVSFLGKVDLRITKVFTLYSQIRLLICIDLRVIFYTL